MTELTNDLSDKDLLDLMKNGRRDAFERLFKKYYYMLWRHSYKFTKDTEASEDIVQEFFIHLWEKINTISIAGSVESYFHVAVKNRSLNHIKAKLRLNIPLEENLDFVFEDTDHLVLEDLSNNIENAINSLPEKCKVIFLMSRESHFSYKEIAQNLDISIKTVETQMGIALKKLKDFLLKSSISLLIFIKIFKIFFPFF